MRSKTNLSFALIFFLACSVAGQAQEPLSLSLDKAIDVALENNEEVLISRNDVRNADAQVREAWADAFPDITFSGLYTRNIKQPVFFFPDPMTGEQMAFRIGSKNAYSMTLNVDQPLFQSGKIFGGIQAASLFKKASREELKAVRSEVILNVKRAYYTVLLNRKLLDINRQSLEQQADVLERTRKLFREGQVSELDTLSSWVDYVNIQPAVLRAENNLRISINRFKDLIGLELTTEIDLSDTLRYEKMGGLSLSELQQEALRNRPDLKRLEFQSDVFQKNITVTRADLLPKLFLNGTYQGVAQSDQFDFGSGFQNSISGSIRLEIPIFNGFRTYARIEQAQVDYENNMHQLEMFKDNLMIEVQTILFNIEEAEKRVEVQREAIAQAERALFMAERRYSEGVGTRLEVGDALLALNVTKTNYTEAVYDHQVAVAELYEAIGRE